MKLKLRLSRTTLIFGGTAVWGLFLLGCVTANRTVLVVPHVPGATLVGDKA